jgi:hypothetical protein
MTYPSAPCRKCGRAATASVTVQFTPAIAEHLDLCALHTWDLSRALAQWLTGSKRRHVLRHRQPQPNR